MNVIKRAKNAWNAMVRREVDLNDEELLEMLGISRDTPKKLISEVTYYTCLKMLSETMGKLPLKYYQETDKGNIRAEPTRATYVLTRRPNTFMTPSTLWSTVEMNAQHYGNGYIWLRRNYVTHGKYGGSYELLDAWPMQSSCVSVVVDDKGVFGDAGGMYYHYSDPRTGKDYVFPSDDVLHIKTWFSFDGIMGEPVRKILQYTIEGAGESQKYMNNLYKSGLTASMAMQYTGEFKEETQRKLQARYEKYLTGPKNAGKIVPIPIGLTLTPLKMSLVDSQFFELRKYSALQIASAFGIKPNQINDYDKSSYANSETQQLAFLVDTMSYRLKQCEEETNAKVLLPEESMAGYFYKFNEKAILRTDAKTQMENLAKAVNNGIYTPNEARGYVDVPAKEGGDILMVNGNYIPITEVGKQYTEGGESNNGSVGD